VDPQTTRVLFNGSQKQSRLFNMIFVTISDCLATGLEDLLTDV